MDAPTCRGSPEGRGGSLLSLCHLYLYGHSPRPSPAPCSSVPQVKSMSQQIALA